MNHQPISKLGPLLLALLAVSSTASAAPLPSSPSPSSPLAAQAPGGSQLLPRAWSQDANADVPILLSRSQGTTMMSDVPLLLPRGGGNKGKGKQNPPSTSGKGKGGSSSQPLDNDALLHSALADKAAHNRLVDAAHHFGKAAALQAKKDRTPEETTQFWRHAKAASLANKDTLAKQEEMRFHAESAKRPFDGTVRKMDPYAAPHRDGRPSEHQPAEAGSSGRQ